MPNIPKATKLNVKTSTKDLLLKQTFNRRKRKRAANLKKKQAQAKQAMANRRRIRKNESRK